MGAKSLKLSLKFSHTDRGGGGDRHTESFYSVLRAGGGGVGPPISPFCSPPPRN